MLRKSLHSKKKGRCYWPVMPKMTEENQLERLKYYKPVALGFILIYALLLCEIYRLRITNDTSEHDASVSKLEQLSCHMFLVSLRIFVPFSYSANSNDRLSGKCAEHVVRASTYRKGNCRLNCARANYYKHTAF